MTPDNQDSRRIGVYTAIAVVAANMIGTGVFTSLGFQLFSLTTGFAIVALWLIGGMVAFLGALCYGEIGAVYPRCGAEYHYLLAAEYEGGLCSAGAADRVEIPPRPGPPD